MSTFERMMQVLGDRMGVDTNRLVETVRSVKSRRQRRGRFAGGAGKRAVACGRAEQLEPRLAMTINIFTSSSANGEGAEYGDAPWFVVTSDKADDVYIQQVATVPQDLLIADNPSFNNAKSIGAFHADGKLWEGVGTVRQMYATNGTKVSVSNVLPIDESNGLESLFVLSQKIPDKVSTAVGIIGGVRGTVEYAGNRWDFSNGGAGSSLAFTLVSPGTISDPALIYPVDFESQVVLTAGGSAGVVSAVSILWSAPAVAATGVTAPTISSITYDIVAATATAPPTTLTEFGLTNSTGARPDVQLPVTPVNPGGIVPGTLSGVLVVDGFPISFEMYSLFPLVNKGSLLLFGNADGPSINGKVTINQGTANPKTTIRVTGNVDYDSGTISLKFTDGEGGPAINPGAVSVSFASYAVYNQDAAASSFTFSPGQTFEEKVFVDLLTPGSAIAINSPIIQTALPTGKGNGELSLRATNIAFNAEVQVVDYLDIGSTDPTRVNELDRGVIAVGATANAIVNLSQGVSAVSVVPGSGGQGYDDSRPLAVQFVGGGGSGATAVAYSLNGVINRVVVTSAGSGYTSLPTVIIPRPQATDESGYARLFEPATAFAEQVTFNAKVTAPNYDIRIADDPSTLAVRRGRMLVTSSGSLTAGASAEGVVTPAGSLFVNADTSDVYVEGTINVNQQSYFFRSPSDAESLAPFVFTTASPSTGVNTGLIQGKAVAMTLGNDLKTIEQQSVASNTVDLRTRIDSLRVSAATRKGDPINGPFPYDLTIREQGDISFDAVASSGRSISLSSTGSIGFTSALSTWGDVSIAAETSFNVTAPITTARGKIAIVADTLTVSNSVRVLDPEVDTIRDDITLTSTAGDLSLTGAIAAVNNVRLVQRNAAGLIGSISGPSRIIAHGINVEAEGSATLKTDAVMLAGWAAGNFTLEELNDITITSLRAPGLVTLWAGGTDPGADNPFSPNPIALTAKLYDVVSLEASAPRGSIDIVTDTSKTLVLGNGSTQTIAGPVVVRAATTGIDRSILVGVKTVSDLGASSYSQGVLGRWASTLSGGFDKLTGSFRPLAVDGVSLTAGDRVLVANQTNAKENGIYVVTSSGSTAFAWVLTRAPEAESPATLAQGLAVTVLAGASAGRSFIVTYDRESALAASNMQAAGAVSIRSLAGPVVVADAPVGGGSAIPVRFAFSGNLSGVYNQGTPGLFSGTLTGSKAALFSDEGVPLGARDRILLTNQTNPNENGIYVVTSGGSAGRNWVLTRAIDADTSGELVSGAFVRVLDGLLAGKFFNVVYTTTEGVTPLAVSMVPNHAGAEAVRVATTSMLSGSYDAGLGTISNAGALPAIDGVSLSVGDRVLVRLGTIDFPPDGTSSTPLPVSAANGLYEVVSLGGVGGTWSLARATNIDTGSAFETGYVLTTEGSYRAAVTGQAFAVSYASLGIDPLKVTQLAAGELVTNIGTEDFNDLTTFVVSSTAGSNDANGSLGKMISLRQSLDTSSSSLNPTPKVDFAFSSVLLGTNGSANGVFRLTQELPVISKAFAINGANRVRLPRETGPYVASIVIDGSRITTARTGQPAAAAAEINGMEFVSGSQSVVGAAGGSVANLTIGGFGNGSAVKINGVGGILVNKLVLGRGETGDRLLNKFGVLATGSGAEGTVAGSTIVGSTQAGIRTESGAAGLTIVGTTVGALNQGNATGIELNAGTSNVGINATVDTKSFIQMVSGQNTFTLPATISPRTVHLGQVVSGPGIAGGTTIAAIKGSTVTLTKAMTATALTKGIRFSSPGRNIVQYNLNGMVLSGGNNVVVNADIGRNSYDGIRTTGGTQMIGTAMKANNLSNSIYGNGRNGVVVIGGRQIVQGNYLGVKGKNQLTNFVVNDVAQLPASVKNRLDVYGNFHAYWR